MIYACEECGFLFYRVGEVNACPNCERQTIRPATMDQTAMLLPYLQDQNIGPCGQEPKKTK